MTIFTTVIFILLATFLLAQFMIAVEHASTMWILLFGFEILAFAYLINNLI